MLCPKTESGQVVLYFHGADAGRKYELIAKDNRAGFEMDCGHGLVMDEESGNCAMNYESVVGKSCIGYLILHAFRIMVPLCTGNRFPPAACVSLLALTLLPPSLPADFLHCQLQHSGLRHDRLIVRKIPLAVMLHQCAHYNDQEDGCWTEESAGKRIHQVLSMEDSYSLILEDGNLVLGFVMGYFKQYDDIVGYTLEEIVIAFEHQNKGIGSALLQEIERQVRERGASSDHPRPSFLPYSSGIPDPERLLHFPPAADGFPSNNSSPIHRGR